jgi:hypothetical protein
MCTTSARTMTIHAAANVGNLYHTRDKWCKRKDQRIYLPSEEATVNRVENTK